MTSEWGHKLRSERARVDIAYEVSLHGRLLCSLTSMGIDLATFESSKHFTRLLRLTPCQLGLLLLCA